MKKIINYLITKYQKIIRHLIAIYEDLLFQNYKKLRRRKSFIQSIREIHVKKGNIRYTLLILETTFGKMKWNLGRNHINELEIKTTIL